MAEFDKSQLVMPSIGAGLALAGSIPQFVEANRLKKERKRLLAEGAPGFSPIELEQMAAARARAASSLAPGYGQEIENINQQQADMLGATRRAGISGSNVLNTLTRLNQQGQAARRNLAMRGAQAQRAAQSELGSMAMGADARREQRKQLWERQLANMDAARRQSMYSAWASPVKGAVAFMNAKNSQSGGGSNNNSIPLSLLSGVGDFNEDNQSIYNTTG